ncbi:hypothetical protein BN137_2796 [Cronobacter condimenti 1330]|uniref:Uncharacterized protein n=1 Tax=Cronobacter condimenti 1330 TaxID=1073999 RepID=K8ACA9_9ENTR|nr:hypothetical protein BN137_2796 [Cronobacter condimenti 1330]
MVRCAYTCETTKPNADAVYFPWQLSFGRKPGLLRAAASPP